MGATVRLSQSFTSPSLHHMVWFQQRWYSAYIYELVSNNYQDFVESEFATRVLTSKRK